LRIFGIVLAAGQGTRMKSKRHKVLHPVCGKPMLGYVVDRLEEVGADRKVVIVGHGADEVKAYLGERAEYALQAEQLGTGHAVLQAASLLGGEEGATIVICGDTPLITAASLEALLTRHRESQAACTIMTAILDDPTGYGRVIRGTDGAVDRIVEHRDCSEEERLVKEINVGTYVFDNRKLFEALGQITSDNAQGEYYLTDAVAILRSRGETVAGVPLDDPDESLGINDRAALAEAERIMRRRIARRHMLAGVTLLDPEHIYIDEDVQIGRDTVIYPGTVLGGNTVIGEDCVIGPNADIRDCTIGDSAAVRHSVLEQSEIAAGVSVGPYAYVRPGNRIGERAKVGSFVEMKNSLLGTGSKVPHLSYVGDADVGQNVNIGCGVITANYDGVRKHRTVIEDEAFIGSNVNLIAPVTVGRGAYVVAGSTITHDVPAEAMAIARERQINKPGYAARLKSRKQQQASAAKPPENT